MLWLKCPADHEPHAAADHDPGHHAAAGPHHDPPAGQEEPVLQLAGYTHIRATGISYHVSLELQRRVSLSARHTFPTSVLIISSQRRVVHQHILQTFFLPFLISTLFQRYKLKTTIFNKIKENRRKEIYAQ